VQRERLLADHVLAGGQRFEHGGGVRDRRSSDKYEPDIGVVVHVMGAAVDGNAQLASGKLPALARGVANSADTETGYLGDQGRVVTRDRSISEEPNPNRSGWPVARGKEQRPMHQLLEPRVLICGRRVPETDVEEPAFADLSLVCHDLIGEAPAGAQQDRGLGRRAFGEIQLVGQPDLGPEC